MVVRDLIFAAAGAVPQIDGKKFRYIEDLSKSLTLYSAPAYGLKKANGKLFAFGNGGLSVSSDGINWQLYPQLNAAAAAAGVDFGGVNDIIHDGTKYVIACDYGVTAVSPDLISWTFSTTLQSTSWGASMSYGSVTSICKTSDRFVVVGDNARMATSTDGLNWTFQTSLRTSAWGWRNPDDSFVTHDVSVVLWAAGRLYAVGGADRIAYSDDNGATWMFVASMGSFKSNFYPCSLVRLNNIWIVGGQAGAYGYSTDGTNWTYSYVNNFVPNYSYIYSITYDGSKYVVAGGVNNAWGCIATSTDLSTWTAVDVTPLTSLSSARWYSSINNAPVALLLEYFSGVYVVKRFWSNWSARTTNLTTWTENTTFNNTNRVAAPNSIAAAPFLQKLLVGGVGTISISDVNNGQVWTTTDFNSKVSASTYVYGLACNSSTIVAAYSSNTESVFTSTNGTTWTKQAGLHSTGWGTKYALDVKYVPFLSKFVIVGSAGGVAVSADGANWTYASSLSAGAWGANDCRRVTYSGSKVLLVGPSGKVATSTDGINWTNQTGLSATAWGTNYVRNCIHDGSKFVVVGDAGCLATSTDGVTWTFSNSVQATSWGTSVSIRGIVYANGVYVICGINSATNNFYVMWSKDLVNWTNSTADENNTLLKVSTCYGFEVFNNSLYLMGGSSLFQNP